MNLDEYLDQQEHDYDIGIKLLRQHNIRKARKLKKNPEKPIDELLYQISKYTLNIKPVIQAKDEKTNTPLLTVITRTSFRKQGFIRIANSVVTQTHPNIHHMVLCDNDEAVKYVKEYYENVKNKKYSIYRLRKQSNNRGFYNLYFNHAIPRVANSSYILLLDDDDRLASKTAVAEFFGKIKNKDLFYIVKIIKNDKSTYPANMSCPNKTGQKFSNFKFFVP